MNTGIQRSGATPYGASTTTRTKRKAEVSEKTNLKDMPMIMAVLRGTHMWLLHLLYILEDFVNKVKKAAAIKGPAYIHLHQPRYYRWDLLQKTIEMGRLAAENRIMDFI